MASKERARKVCAKSTHRGEKNITDLYDVNLKAYLDDDLNYHYMEKGPHLNLFENYTHNALPYLNGVKSILDVGCGYGGPARYISKHKPECRITCITNSKSQYKAVSPLLTCYLTKAENYFSNDRFDIAVFFDSLCHMDGPKALANISNYTDKILIKDYCYFGADYYYSSRWEMSFRSKDNWERMLSSIGLEIKDYKLNHNVLIEQSHLFWNDKAKDSLDLHRQISLIKQIPKSPTLNDGKAHCIIYAAIS